MSAHPRQGRAQAGGALLLLALAGCEVGPVGPVTPSLAGAYILMSVQPPGPVPDSGGGTVSVLNGRLVLGPAAPEPYVYTPGGAMARSCVHEVPNGAFVDTANVVHLPDGTTYHLPRCGTGSYTLRFTRQHVAADGTTRVAADSSVGLYTWSTEGSTAGIMTLVDARMVGSITFGAAGPVIRLAPRELGPPITISAPPVYLFSFPPAD